MKRIFLTLFIGAFIPAISFAQNTFPSTGNAGIGTTSPQAPLDIFVSASGPVQNFTSSSGGLGAQFTLAPKTASSSQFCINFPGVSSGTGNWLVYRYGNTLNKWYFGDDGTHAYLQSIHDMQFATNASYDPSTSLVPAMVITTTSNIGIGTTTPKSTLQINGSFITSGNNANMATGTPATIPNNLANTGQMLIGWNRTSGSGETDFISNQGTGNQGGFAFYNHDNSNNETQLMWIQGNGNVAIGTSDPKGYKLAVNGTAIATSMTVKLNANWPDYVFKKDYQLPSLTEIKTYIDQNGHLPEIPSEQEITKNGLNLGDINKALVKKVEELTLYLIEKEKQIDYEHKENQKQQSQIDELRQQLEALAKEIHKN